MTNDIDERLKRLLRDFDDLLTNTRLLKKSPNIKQTTPDDLVRFFGLTPNEAEEWLDSEPSFNPSDDSYHEPSNRRKVTKTLIWILVT
jgi:hypothetical protein